jgi:hypothetical protein
MGWGHGMRAWDGGEAEAAAAAAASAAAAAAAAVGVPLEVYRNSVSVRPERPNTDRP